MAKITIETHNVTVPATSGNSMYSIVLSDCEAVDVLVSGGSMSLDASLNRMGDVLMLEWGANNTTAGRACLIIVIGEDQGGNRVSDYMAFNQMGSSYNVNLSGPTDFEGNSGTSSYSISSNIAGSYEMYSDTAWVSVGSLSKTGSNSATASLVYTRNNSDSRIGIIRLIFSFQYNPYTVQYFMVLTQGTYVEMESVFYYEPNTVNLSYDSGTFTSSVPVVQNVTSIGIKSMSGNLGISSASIDSTSGRLIVSYDGNTGETELSETFIISGTGTNGQVTTSFYFYQGSYSYAVNPIWKTTTVEVAGKSYIDYTVSTEGVTVYSGRAYQMPGNDSITFELNEIVRDYVDNYFWWRQGYQTPSGWQRSFEVEMDNGTGGNYIFTKDWSYTEKNYSGSKFICLNEPIIKKIPSGCFVPICIFSPQRSGDASFISTNTGNITNLDYGVHLDSPKQARYVYVSSPGYKYGYVGGGIQENDIYEGAADCKSRYVVYYENAYGGIDALPIQGNALATDKITPYTTKNSVWVPSNNFSYRRYLNEITKSWELRTGYLSDEQASRMHHLIGSTLVYLYDIEKAEVYPVVIDDTSVQYKTFKNQGRKFFNYTFNVKESQTKIRK